MENNPVAPTDAQAPASVASTTNSNEQSPAAPTQALAPEAAAPAEPTPEQMAKYLGTTVEGLEKAKKFYENNGGFDKVFGERKAEISTPKSQQPQSQIPASGQNQLNDDITQTQPVTAQQPTSNLSMQNIEAMAVKEFFKELAANPEYANIADKLTDGTVMDQANKMFNIPLFANGDVNRSQLTDFAKMYSKTLPAAPASAPVTNIPTVSNEPVQFTGPINTTVDAVKIVQENNAMMAAGQGEHPRLKEAKEFLTKGFKSRNPGRDEFAPWQGKAKD